MFTPVEGDQALRGAAAQDRRRRRPELHRGVPRRATPSATTRRAANDGFDDVADDRGLDSSRPSSRPGNWDALAQHARARPARRHPVRELPRPAGRRAPHGPHANSTNLDLGARISWSSDVCASCHQEGPYDYKPSQWETGKHADLTLALLDAHRREARGRRAAHCGRCHSAQGFAAVRRSSSRRATRATSPSTASRRRRATPPNAATDRVAHGLGLTQAQRRAADLPRPATIRTTRPTRRSSASTTRWPRSPTGSTNVSGMGAGHDLRDLPQLAQRRAHRLTPSRQRPTGVHRAARRRGADRRGVRLQRLLRAAYNPSPHLAVADTCAGCHYKAVTASEQARQADVEPLVRGRQHHLRELPLGQRRRRRPAGGATRWSSTRSARRSTGKVQNLVNAALLPASGGAYTVRVWDPVSDQYSSAAASNVLARGGADLDGQLRDARADRLHPPHGRAGHGRRW